MFGLADIERAIEDIISELAAISHWSSTNGLLINTRKEIPPIVLNGDIRVAIPLKTRCTWPSSLYCQLECDAC